MLLDNENKIFKYNWQQETYKVVIYQFSYINNLRFIIFLIQIVQQIVYVEQIHLMFGIYCRPHCVLKNNI